MDNAHKPHLSRLVLETAHRHDNAIRTRMESLGISKAIGPVLVDIAHREGISQSELATRMHFKASSISVTIQKMCDMGLLSRVADEADGRKEGLYLTDLGREKFRLIHETFDVLNAEFCAPLTVSEQETLRALLEKLNTPKEDIK